MPKLKTAPKKRDLELAFDAAVRIMMNLDKEFCLNFPIYDYMPAWEKLLIEKINEINHETMIKLIDRVFPDPRQIEIPVPTETTTTTDTQTHAKTRAPARKTKKIKK